jgi:hypothetical protein
VSYVDPETGQPGKGVVDSVMFDDGFAYLKVGAAVVGLADLTAVHGASGKGGGDETADGPNE